MHNSNTDKVNKKEEVWIVIKVYALINILK